MRNHLIIKNCRVISPGLDLDRATVEVEDGQIKRVLGPENQPPPAEYAATPTHDAHGSLLMPGFIDIHTHGAMGADTCDGTETAVRTIAMAKKSPQSSSFPSPPKCPAASISSTP
jgi:N-acetylglucosamine-6-phosphate deacetylase